MPPPSACLWPGVGQGHDDSKTIFAMLLLRLLQDASIIDALGVMGSLPGEAVGHRVRRMGRSRERDGHEHIRSPVPGTQLLRGKIMGCHRAAQHPLS